MFALISAIRRWMILASLSGIASIAIVVPDGPGPSATEKRTVVASPVGVRSQRHLAPGLSRSTTLHANTRSTSKSVMKFSVDHSPTASCLLCPVNVASGPGPTEPSAAGFHSAPRSSSENRAGSSMSDTRLHTRVAGASTVTST
jgi:hypothetical protein